MDLEVFAGEQLRLTSTGSYVCHINISAHRNTTDDDPEQESHFDYTTIVGLPVSIVNEDVMRIGR